MSRQATKSLSQWVRVGAPVRYQQFPLASIVLTGIRLKHAYLMQAILLGQKDVAKTTLILENVTTGNTELAAVEDLTAHIFGMFSGRKTLSIRHTRAFPIAWVVASVEVDC